MKITRILVNLGLADRPKTSLSKKFLVKSKVDITYMVRVQSEADPTSHLDARALYVGSGDFDGFEPGPSQIPI